jgi:SulP family sulfate permease
MEAQVAAPPLPKYLFNRLELAGSLGDLGTLLPLAIGLIVINGLDAAGVLFVVGLYYILSGVYFGVTVPVQPMKVIGAYAIAKLMTPAQITAAGLLMGVFMLAVGLSGAIHLIGRYTPKPVVRGVQLAVGVLLMAQGVKFMAGTSSFQLARALAEPHLAVQAVGPLPIGIVLGVAGALLTLLLLDNERLPAGLVVVGCGLAAGFLLGAEGNFSRVSLGLHLPRLLPFGWPAAADFGFAFFALALPQAPMTIGNAVIANADLSRQYFGERARQASYRGLANSMGLALVASFLVGGMPVCHGAGGLAAHYRFGARTAGSNIMIGAIFLALALFLGPSALRVLYLLPLSILGVLLIFAGGQLALTVRDLTERSDLFVALAMVGIAIGTNLAVAFLVGIALAYAFRTGKLSI